MRCAARTCSPASGARSSPCCCRAWTARQAFDTGRRLIDAITAAGTPDALVEPLTVSIGVASVRGGDDVGDLMARADADMYAAKRRGGNDIGRAAPGGVTTA